MTTTAKNSVLSGDLSEDIFFDQRKPESLKKLYRLLLVQNLTKNGSQLDLHIRKLIVAVRVYLKKPRILLMDENFLSLNTFKDYTIYGKFWKMKVSILSILSDLKNVLLYDRVYILNQGSIIESGSPQ